MAAIAVHVFGKPITHGTRTQRALAAKNSQNADGKLDQVLLVSNQAQKVAAGGGTVTTTVGKVYNATGDTVTYVTAHDWEGNVLGVYQVNIQNGQWAVFKHLGNRQGSVGAVVYRLGDGCCDSMISWNNPRKSPGQNNNTAYCKMNDPGYFDDCDWNVIQKKLLASAKQSEASMEGYSTTVTIEAGGNTPSFTAYFHLDV